ncbi:MAG: PilZ domain-containing protein [Deltaproteobacteria bacterium]|nr:PilZ domain-containing protein [Deltaproteobacteria bacterium]
MKTLPSARPVSLEGEVLTVEAGLALPPGTRVALELADPAGGATLSVAGKIVGLARSVDGTLRIRVRLHNVGKADKESLARLVGASGA